MRYGGFWIRFVASLIDGLVLTVAAWLLTILFGLQGAMLGAMGGTEESVGIGILMAFLLSNLFTWILALAYYWLLTGLKGATLGKMALGLKVVNQNGQVAGLGPAFLREVIGKFISGIILLIGYLWAAFDSKKQALRDKIAGTYVVYANSLSDQVSRGAVS